MRASARVLDLVKQIPKGKVMTYGALARWAGIASAQCIGQILHRNPHPVEVPCHRVVAKDGRLHGYALGLEMKADVLRAEGVEVVDFRIDLARFGWIPEAADKK